jgi:hypothetical protein
MVDYILRNAAIANSREYDLGGGYDNTEIAVPVDVINAIPASDVRPVVRGRWKERRLSENVYGFECSVCHTTWDSDTSFCPFCGADMRRKADA